MSQFGGKGMFVQVGQKYLQDISDHIQLGWHFQIFVKHKYLTEEERVEVRRSNDRKYYNQNPEAKQEKLKQYQLANKEYILQRKKTISTKKI